MDKRDDGSGILNMREKKGGGAGAMGRQTMGGIAREIERSLRGSLIEVVTEERNMDVVEYCLVEDELTRLSDYDSRNWRMVSDGLPSEPGKYWFSVECWGGAQDVVLVVWYGQMYDRETVSGLRDRHRLVVAWMPCIMPEPCAARR